MVEQSKGPRDPAQSDSFLASVSSLLRRSAGPATSEAMSAREAAASAITHLPGPKRSGFISGLLVCSMLPWILLCLQTSKWKPSCSTTHTRLQGRSLLFRTSFKYQLGSSITARDLSLLEMLLVCAPVFSVLSHTSCATAFLHLRNCGDVDSSTLYQVGGSSNWTSCLQHAMD